MECPLQREPLPDQVKPMLEKLRVAGQRPLSRNEAAAGAV